MGRTWGLAPPDFTPVEGDPAELREAVTNLVLNALDAMPFGGTVVVTTSATRRRVSVSIRDTGSGMSPEVKRRVFDPFFTTKGQKGTGLGLSVTSGIVTRHRGRIEVDSAPGEGSTFRISLPIPARIASPPRPGPPLVPIESSQLRCLVVDDHPMVANALGDALASAGHAVHVVHDGAMAISRLDGERFDVVIADLAMPGKTGWDVADAVKKAHSSARLILMSGFSIEKAGNSTSSSPTPFSRSRWR